MKGRLIKGVVAWLMSFAMLVGVIGVVSPMRVNAADDGSGVTFGTPKWNDGRTEYSFPNVTVGMPEGVDKQRVFCISVSNGGSFTIKKESFTNAVDISGVELSTGTYVDNSGETGTKAIDDTLSLISVTVLGDLKDADIKSFIKNMVFSRNGVGVKDKQKVSVVTSIFDVRDYGATAISLDGDIHYYKYVDWNDEVSKKYVGKSTVTSLPASPVKDDSTKWTWYTAYSLAKQEKIDVSSDGTKYLKGYLATITSVAEQNFIYNKLGVEKGAGHAQGAWIGGARTYTIDENYKAVGADYDKDEITALYPIIDGNTAVKWKWMCGPESHNNTPQTRVFYTIASPNNGYHGGTVNTYAAWNPGTEPNNHNVASTKDSNRQEYVLHYGYTTGGNWNDWYPACSEKTESTISIPAGYLIEFSPYDINDDGDVSDPGEKGSSDVHKDLTVVTAEPSIVDAKLDRSTFVKGDTISVVSVIGDAHLKAGVPNDELIDTTVPEYQWEVFDNNTNKWSNATGVGAKTDKYVVDATDVGKKLRCHITASADPARNPNYAGEVYVSVKGADDNGEKIDGTDVIASGATITGNNFMISETDAENVTSDKVRTSSLAKATSDGTNPTTVKDVASSELEVLKKTKEGESANLTLVNGSNETVKTTVKATVFDNVTTSGDGKRQIGSNDFSVKASTSNLNANDIINRGLVTVLQDGVKDTTATYTVNGSDLGTLNGKINSNTEGYVDVHVTDNTGLETIVRVTVIPTDKVALESAKLTPYKKTIGYDGKPEHYYAGDTITVSEVKLNDGTVYTGNDLTNGKFTYQWQYSTDGNDPWNNIGGETTTGITLNTEQTEAIAKNKVRVLIKATNASGIPDKSVTLYVDGDASSKDNCSGTYIDRLAIDAYDFVVSLEQAKSMNDSDAEKAANVVDEWVNNLGVNKTVSPTYSDSNVETTLNKVTEPTVVDVTYTSGVNNSIGKDKFDENKIGKTVKAYVKDKASQGTGNSGKKISIGANDFEISAEDVVKVIAGDDGILKNLSSAIAIANGIQVSADELIVSDKSSLKPVDGTYDVTFSYDGVSVTVKAKVNGTVILPSDNKDKTPAITGTTNTNPENIIYEKTNPQDKPEPIDPNKTVPTTGGLKINGVPVDKYTVTSDGTKILISKDYLNTLPNGDYPAEIIYTDGSSQKFTISVIDYDKRTIVKNPPLFSMYKEIVLKKKNTFTINLKGISDYAVVSSKITGKGKKAKKIVSIKQQKNGEVLITPKKTGKTQVTCTIIQNGAEYKVVVDIKVLNQYKGTSKNYNLKNKGLVKTSGELPEFNVYKRIVKGKNTKIKFTKVAKDAKVKFYVANKKEAKSLKIGKVKRKGKTVTCTVMGKKKGWVHLTAEITQNGKTYYTRLLVRIDDGTWSKKQLKKYLK
ncbi:MAG: hypothetical protein K6G76_03120 [Lachnospiraceae bacterium]|nr:hypothetical protein [Lachnospiraceae bacterium]